MGKSNARRLWGIFSTRGKGLLSLGGAKMTQGILSRVGALVLEVYGCMYRDCRARVMSGYIRKHQFRVSGLATGLRAWWFSFVCCGWRELSCPRSPFKLSCPATGRYSNLCIPTDKVFRDKRMTV